MFDIGAPELFIVAVLAIIVVGPKDLPKLLRSVMSIVRKVKEMGSEFQAGVKKMADEVELDAVTRKLNEAGNIPLDDDNSKNQSSNQYGEYDEFDYDEYDYDNSGENDQDEDEEADNAVEEKSEQTSETEKDDDQSNKKDDVKE